MVNIARQPLLVLSAVLLSCGAWGCSRSQTAAVTEPETPTSRNLIQIGHAYMQYISQKKTLPTGPKDLLPLLKAAGDPEAMLRSDRDNQPLVICWGVDTRRPPSWATSTPVLGYEKQGVSGSRYVLYMSHGMRVKLMSEAEFRKASFPPGHTPEF